MNREYYSDIKGVKVITMAGQSACSGAATRERSHKSVESSTAQMKVDGSPIMTGPLNIGNHGAFNVSEAH
jgi:hypothetical protein